MGAAREKIDGVLRHLAQRQDRQRQAAAAWQRSKERCLQLAKTLLDGTGARAELLGGDVLLLTAKHGAFAYFGFDPRQLGLVGLRRKAGCDKVVDWAKEGEAFFSLPIEPPAARVSVGPGQWGPQYPDGGLGMSGRMDSQQAFEKAIADWFEWAHMGEGAPPAGA